MRVVVGIAVIGARSTAWRRENPEAQSAVQRRSYGRHRGRRIAQATEYERERGRPKDALKVQARSEVNKALKRGALVKGPCEIATGCEGSVQAHHDDYAKPLDVRWLCSKHHGQHHRKEHDGCVVFKTIGR